MTHRLSKFHRNIDRNSISKRSYFSLRVVELSISTSVRLRLNDPCISHWERYVILAVHHERLRRRRRLMPRLYQMLDQITDLGEGAEPS